MRKAAMALATFGLLFAAVPALAQTDNDIEIFLDGIIRGDPGSINEVYNEPVPSNLVGQNCAGFAATQNNASEHLDNDLIIASGGDSTEILNFEALAGGTTFTAGTLTLGPTLVLSVRLGPARVSSGGLLVVLNCSQPEPTTTTTAPPSAPTTTTAPPSAPTTTAPPPLGATTTTEAPPVGGVAAGGGGTAAGANPAVPWVGGGALLLVAALGAAAIGRQLVTKRD